MFKMIKVCRCNKFNRGSSVIISIVFFFALLLNPTYAQSIDLLNLPLPGTMVKRSPAFVPIMLRGLTIHPQDPFAFDFIIDSGNSQSSPEEIKQESERLVTYFLAALTMPQDDLWVNLSPYEGERIIPDALSRTGLGRDLLAQDYLLKQLSSSLIHPESETGRQFWDRVYQKAWEKYGTTEVPINTFNKVWIMPAQADVYEHGQTVYITHTRLKVMLDEDYLAMENNVHNRLLGTDQLSSNEVKESSSLSAQIVREIILPEIEKEVNEGRNFASLRQIYHCLILAQWYKETVKESILSREYVGHKKIEGITLDDHQIKEKIYTQYMAAARQGAFNLIREDYDTYKQKTIPRKYFSGGNIFTHIPLRGRIVPLAVENAAMGKTYGLSMRAQSLSFDNGFDNNGVEQFRETTKSLWHEAEPARLKEEFNQDLVALGTKGKAAVFFFAADTDGLTSAALLLKKLKNIAHASGREVKMIYSPAEIPEQQDDDVLYIYAKRYSESSFMDHETVVELTNIYLSFGRIPFYQFDMSWHVAYDFDFLERRFDVSLLDHHVLTPEVKDFLAKKERHIRVVNPHDYVDASVADRYIVAGIVSDMFDIEPGYELAIASVPDNYRNFPEVAHLYEDDRIGIMETSINSLDMTVSKLGVSHEQITRGLIDVLVNNATVDAAFGDLNNNKDLIQNIVEIEHGVEVEVRKINDLVAATDANVIVHEITSENYIFVSPVFKRLRGMLRNDERFRSKVLIVYQHMRDGQTRFRIGTGRGLSGFIDLADICSGNGFSKVSPFGGGHADRAGGDVMSRLDLSFEEQQQEFQKSLDAGERPHLKTIGFRSVLYYLQRSLQKQITEKFLQVKKNGKRLVFLGPPGSGKTTVAARLAALLGIPHISVGDLLTEISQGKKDYGLDEGTLRYIAQTVRTGGLVKNDVTDRIIQQRLMMDDARGGFILDGYPREEASAKSLEGFLAAQGLGINGYVVIDVPQEISRQRLMADNPDRRAREDDASAQSISSRMEIFNTLTREVLGRRPERLVMLNGDQSRDDVYEELIRKLSEVNNSTAPSETGGIDMNRIHLKRQGGIGPMEFSSPAIEMPIDGLRPVIINLVPINNVLPLLGIEKGVSEHPLNVSSLNETEILQK